MGFSHFTIWSNMQNILDCSHTRPWNDMIHMKIWPWVSEKGTLKTLLGKGTIFPKPVVMKVFDPLPKKPLSPLVFQKKKKTSVGRRVDGKSRHASCGQELWDRPRRRVPLLERESGRPWTTRAEWIAFRMFQTFKATKRLFIPRCWFIVYGYCPFL